MKLRLIDGPEAPVQPEHAVAAVIFPSEGRTFRVPAKAETGAKPLMLEIATDQGPQYVPIEVARN